MPTPADATVLRQAQARIAELAQQDLSGFWDSLDLNRPERSRNELLEFVPALTTVYGEAAATVAADWYDEVRGAEGVTGRFAAPMSGVYPPEYVEQRVRYGARHLFTEQPGLMLPFLAGAVQKYTLQPGRDTVLAAVESDSKARGWHRQTQGETCGFCRMLAGRGGVYLKEKTATFAAHEHCDCVAVPSWDADAQEVPVEAYVASQRVQYERDKAASGDADAQERLALRRQRVRESIARMDDN